MSTGNINLDILLDEIQRDAIAGTDDSVYAIRRRYPALTEKQAREIHALVTGAGKKEETTAELVVTAPPTFGLKTVVTKVVVDSMLKRAKKSILITGYSVSGYFNELIDCIIDKSQRGVTVKFYVNHIEDQSSFAKLRRYKGNFLKIYNYPKQDDKMSALHAKVISIDKKETLITSANLSYHGQEGNIELGTHITSEDIAKQVDEIFTKLLFKKIFTEL